MFVDYLISKDLIQIIISHKRQEMAAIINYIKEHEKVCLGLSLATLATYLIFRQKTAKKRNILEVTLKQLLARARHPKVRKIVITNNPKSTGNFRRNLVSFLKSKLLEEKIKVLINCSPQKLLKSGCECYLESMQSNDTDYDNYYFNAIKAQLLIEDTIISIETINQNESPYPILMICDNNPMDIRLLNESDQLWVHTLQKYEISEESISQSYDIIIHAIQNGSTPQDERIAKIWQNHPCYHQIHGEQGKLRQKYEEAYQIVMRFLSAQRQKAV